MWVVGTGSFLSGYTLWGPFDTLNQARDAAHLFEGQVPFLAQVTPIEAAYATVITEGTPDATPG